MEKYDMLRSLSIRQNGKTSLLKAGVDNYNTPFFVVVNKLKQGGELTKNKNCTLVTPQTLYKTFGSSDPIIVDQEVVVRILKDCRELDRLFFETRKKETLLEIENKNIKMDLQQEKARTRTLFRQNEVLRERYMELKKEATQIKEALYEIKEVINRTK